MNASHSGLKASGSRFRRRIHLHPRHAIATGRVSRLRAPGSIGQLERNIFRPQYKVAKNVKNVGDPANAVLAVHCQS